MFFSENAAKIFQQWHYRSVSDNHYAALDDGLKVMFCTLLICGIIVSVIVRYIHTLVTGKQKFWAASLQKGIVDLVRINVVLVPMTRCLSITNNLSGRGVIGPQMNLQQNSGPKLISDIIKKHPNYNEEKEVLEFL